MAALEALDKAINDHDSSTSESVTGSVDSVQRMPDLVIEANGIETNHEEKGGNKTYASVAEMKRMKVSSGLIIFSVDLSKLTLCCSATEIYTSDRKTMYGYEGIF